MELEKQEEVSIIINWGLPLPARIASVIFSKVSISNLPAFRLVCKSWNRLVLDYGANSSRKAILYSIVDNKPPHFSSFLNPKIQCFDIDTLKFVGSCTIVGPLTDYISIYSCCNGLLFLANGGVEIGTQSEGIFNPMTHEFFPVLIHDEFHLGYYHAFGFSPNTKQYKLFRVIDSGCHMKILRFGTNPNQWISVSLPSDPPITLRSHGTYFDGLIYWIGKLENQNEYIIYALDVETETFERIALLDGGPHTLGSFGLQPFNGTIYAIIVGTKRKPYQIQLWRMQVKDSWIKDFIVRIHFKPKSFQLLKASDDGKIFVRINQDLFWLNKSAGKIEMENQIKTLIPSDKKCYNLCTCLIESLHFSSLSSILAGHD